MKKSLKTIKPISLGNVPGNLEVVAPDPRGRNTQRRVQPLYQPQYQPDYYQPVAPAVYREPFHVKPFNTTLVAIAGIGILVTGVYFLVGGKTFLSSWFTRNPDKDQMEPHAIMAQRFHEAVSGIGKNLVNLYAIAQEISEKQDKKDFFSKMAKWYEKKYGESMQSRIGSEFNANEVQRFYDIISGSVQFAPQQSQQIQQQQSTSQQIKQATGLTDQPDTVVVASKFKKGNVLVSRGEAGIKVRFAPYIQNASLYRKYLVTNPFDEGNVFFSTKDSKPVMLGVSTGKAFKTTQTKNDGTRVSTVFEEFVMKVDTESDFDKFYDRIKADTSVQASFNLNISGMRKMAASDTGLTLYTAQSNVQSGEVNFATARSKSGKYSYQNYLLYPK